MKIEDTIRLLKAGRKLELPGEKIFVIQQHLDEQGIAHKIWFESMDGFTVWIKLVFPRREYPHRYVIIDRWLLEIDNEGIVVGRVSGLDIKERLEYLSCVYWDGRHGDQFDLQIGDQYVPPERYPDD